jgi:hypothetical protein
MVYYVTIKGRGGYTVGSFNRHKIEMMYKGYKIEECEPWEFKGQMLGYEYID